MLSRTTLILWYLLVVSAVLLLILSYRVSLPRRPTVLPRPSVRHRSFHHGFVPWNGNGVYSFRNVCIEVGPLVLNESRPENSYFCNKGNTTCRIVVYDNTMNISATQRITKKLPVSYPNAPVDTHWTVEIVKGPIPDGHHIDETVAAAYFVEPSLPGNFHHFWTDEFILLWYTMFSTGGLRLNRKEDFRNKVLYQFPYHLVEEPDMGSYSIERYEPILKTLYIHDRHEAFWLTKTNTCFTNGVFGSAWNGYTPEQKVVQYVTRAMCGNVNVTAKYVTLIHRSQRRLLNIDEMARTARKVFGEKRVRVAVLEEMTLKEQLRLAAESCVLIGVQGAGLQWTKFISNPSNSTLIEIAWPTSNWLYVYSDWYRDRMQTLQLAVESQDVHINWTSYEWNVHGGQTLNDTERQQILQLGYPINIKDNLWKWADVNVDVNKFESVLRQSIC